MDWLEQLVPWVFGAFTLSMVAAALYVHHRYVIPWAHGVSKTVQTALPAEPPRPAEAPGGVAEQRNHSFAARCVITVFVVVIAGAVLYAGSGVDPSSIGAGAFGLLAALWSPWGLVTILAALVIGLASLAGALVGVFMLLFVAAGGHGRGSEPDLSPVLTVVGVLFLVLLGAVGEVIRCEVVRGRVQGRPQE
jgi:hypothetical protein